MVRRRRTGVRFAYTTGAEQALEQADRDGWTVVSIRDDRHTVF